MTDVVAEDKVTTRAEKHFFFALFYSRLVLIILVIV
jgi:hypothetical protein